jgi:hypothetical protein
MLRFTELENHQAYEATEIKLANYLFSVQIWRHRMFLYLFFCIFKKQSKHTRTLRIPTPESTMPYQGEYSKNKDLNSQLY